MSINTTDSSFGDFASHLMNVLNKYGDLLKSNVKLTPAQRDVHLLAIQKKQLTSLLALENEFRLLIQEAGVAEDIYKKFIVYIRDERKNILIARPFFRERQPVFTAYVSPALDQRNYKSLMNFSFNATFIQFALRCRRWNSSSEKFLSKFMWWKSLPNETDPPLVPNEQRLMVIVDEIFKIRNILVECNLPLIVDWASKFYRKTPNSHLTRMDMVNIAAEGHMAAIDKLELAAIDQNTFEVIPWQGEEPDVTVFDKEPGSVFRSVSIGRMTGNLIESYSQTILHFWPKDRRKLYRANKNRAKMEPVVSGEPVRLWSGLDGVDFDKLAQVVNIDEKNGQEVLEIHRTDANEIADLMAASSCISPIDAEGNDQMSLFAANANWQPDTRLENSEIMSKMALAIKDLSLLERKLLALSGVELV